MDRIMNGEANLIPQEPTPSEAWMWVEQAIAPESPNWGLNLTIFWKVRSNELNASEVVKAIKKKIIDESPDVQSQTLHLLETFGHKCDVFYNEVASQELHEDLVRLVDNPQNNYINRRRAFKLIRAWAESRDTFRGRAFRRVYYPLVARVPRDMSERKTVPVLRSLESFTPEEDPMDLLDKYQPMSERERVDLLEGRSQPKFVQDRKKYLVAARKSIKSLSSILYSEGEPKPLKESSTSRWLDRCFKSSYVLMEIWETCTNDELDLWLETVSVNDQLELLIKKYRELAATEMNVAQQPGPAKHEAEAVQNLNELTI